MVETNRSTSHMVYNIQQSATQDSNDTTQRLSRRTAATTRFSPESKRLPETDGAKLFANDDPIRWAFTLQAFTRWRHQRMILKFSLRLKDFCDHQVTVAGSEIQKRRPSLKS